MRNIGQLGLINRFKHDIYTKDLLLKMMALPLLPYNHIRVAYDKLARSISPDDVLLVQFNNYMERQWMSSTVHPLSSISVFKLSIRTNNDCEGYHNRLKCMSREGIYILYIIYIYIYIYIYYILYIYIYNII